MARIAFLAALMAGLAGCGYSLAGKGTFLPAHIKIIGVPAFENLTDRRDLDKIITDAVVQELSSRGKYVLRPDKTEVDAVLDGKVIGFTITPVGFDSGLTPDVNTQASRYTIIVRARIEFKDLKQNKTLWSDANFSFRDEYDVGDDPDAFFDQQNLSLDRLAEEFAKTLVSRILEAF